MVFRLPTPFDAIVPSPPSIRRNTRARPWRGAFNLLGINLFQTPSGQQRLLVASAETEGDNRTDLWPKQFDVHVAQHACPVADVQAWVTRNEIPLCMFMPDRYAPGGSSSSRSSTNEAHFRALSRVLIENQLLCIAPWPAPGFPETRGGAGILIFPNISSTGLFLGAVFIDAPFPDFMGLLPGGAGASAIPSGLPSAGAGGPFSSPANLDFSFASSYALPDPGPGQGQGQGQGSRQGQFREDSPAAPFMQPFAMASGAGYSKPQMDSFTGDRALRSALAAAPFDWTMFDDTTDGSGSTSPGSSRTW